jgi:hypothetical protein
MSTTVTVVRVGSIMNGIGLASTDSVLLGESMVLLPLVSGSLSILRVGVSLGVRRLNIGAIGDVNGTVGATANFKMVT